MTNEVTGEILRQLAPAITKLILEDEMPTKYNHLLTTMYRDKSWKVREFKAKTLVFPFEFCTSCGTYSTSTYGSLTPIVCICPVCVLGGKEEVLTMKVEANFYYKFHSEKLNNHLTYFISTI